MDDQAAVAKVNGVGDPCLPGDLAVEGILSVAGNENGFASKEVVDKDAIDDGSQAMSIANTKLSRSWR